MAKIQRFKVMNLACFLGLFGVFMGLLFGIIMFVLTSFVGVSAGSGLAETIYNKIAGWMYLLLSPLIGGILYFLLGLIVALIINLILKIIKGLELDIDLTESTTSVDKTVKSISTKPANTIKSLTSVKNSKNPLAVHPLKSTKDSSPISQMTNSKTTQKIAPKTSVKPAI